jgi:hypothetical protein
MQPHDADDEIRITDELGLQVVEKSLCMEDDLYDCADCD